ncbi:cytochrome c oxidase subunit II [Pelagovum pacificum]
MMTLAKRGLLTAVSSMAAVAAYAQEAPDFGELEIIGAPHASGVGFQEAGTNLATQIHRLDGMLLIIITAITLLVMGLLAWVILRFNSRANKNPATFTHNSPLEITWTIVPIVILVFIGAFSLPVLFDQQEIPEGDIHVKVTGYQWYWSYEYTDEEIYFESRLIGTGQGNLNDEIIANLEAAGYSEDEWLLATDNAVILPVGATVVMDVTGSDVIHSWTIPAFGVKQDAVPGRLAQLWFAPEKEGIYFGQCSELCGKDHAYMPITVKVVSQEDYDAWLEYAREEFPA